MLLDLADVPMTTSDPNPEVGIYQTVDVSSDYGRNAFRGVVNAQVLMDRARRANRLPFEAEIKSFSDRATSVDRVPARTAFKKAGDIAGKKLQAFAAVEQRIWALREEARAEGYSVSKASERDLLGFLEALQFTKRPFVSLLDNGNLRAFWKNAEGEKLGLQFLGNREVQYVFFAKRNDDQYVARASGRDVLACISSHIKAQGLEKLLHA